MVVGEVAARTLAHLRVAAEVGHELVAFVEGEQRRAALATVESPLTARKGREYVELVHGADLERVAALPRAPTLHTLHSVTTTTKATTTASIIVGGRLVHAGDAQGVHVLTSLERVRDLERPDRVRIVSHVDADVVVVVRGGRCCCCCCCCMHVVVAVAGGVLVVVAAVIGIVVEVVDWREIESAIDERKAIVDGQHERAAHTRHVANARARQMSEHKGADLVVAERSLVLDAQRERVELGARHLAEQAGPRARRTLAEYVAVYEQCVFERLAVHLLAAHALLLPHGVQLGGEAVGLRLTVTRRQSVGGGCCCCHRCRSCCCCCCSCLCCERTRQKN